MKPYVRKFQEEALAEGVSDATFDRIADFCKENPEACEAAKKFFDSLGKKATKATVSKIEKFVHGGDKLTRLIKGDWDKLKKSWEGEYKYFTNDEGGNVSAVGEFISLVKQALNY